MKVSENRKYDKMLAPIRCVYTRAYKCCPIQNNNRDIVSSVDHKHVNENDKFNWFLFGCVYFFFNFFISPAWLCVVVPYLLNRMTALRLDRKESLFPW